MYTKEQASQVRQRFYTKLGQYMAPIQSADGRSQNWINYKTGVRSILIRMETPNRNASISLIVTHSDHSERIQIFTELQALKAIFEAEAGADWIWEQEALNSTGQEISKISAELTNVSVLNEADWPALISFFKPRLLALDQFWSMVRFQFEP